MSSMGEVGKATINLPEKSDFSVLNGLRMKYARFIASLFKNYSIIRETKEATFYPQLMR